MWSFAWSGKAEDFKAEEVTIRTVEDTPQKAKEVLEGIEQFVRTLGTKEITVEANGGSDGFHTVFLSITSQTPEGEARTEDRLVRAPQVGEREFQGG